MLRTSRFRLGLLVALVAALVLLSRPLIALGGADPAQSASQTAAVKPVSASPDIPFRQSEVSSQEILFQLANQSRAQAGVPALLLNQGLSRAAQIHAHAMLEKQQLSHQFRGEPSLMQRLAATSDLQLDRAGENVAFDADAQRGHQHLMLSAPHRANLLNPAYNVIGLGVVRDGDRLYIVEDFGHALPTYSSVEVKNRVAITVNQMRREAKRALLERRDTLTTADAACSMAKADSLGTAQVQQLAQRSTVLTYTSMHPDTLPNEAERALSTPSLHSLSVGACYARTATYPTGAYWVVLELQ